MLSRPIDRYPAALLKRWLFVVLALSVAFAGLHHFGHAHAHAPGDPDTVVTTTSSAEASGECCFDHDTPPRTPCFSVCAAACSACVPITEHVQFDGRSAITDFSALAAVHPRSYRSAPFRPPRFA